MKIQIQQIADLQQFDAGKLAIEFRNQLERVKRDCLDRAGVKAPRKLSVVLSCLPDADEQGHLISVGIEAEVKVAVPVARTARVHAAVNEHEGGFVYEDLSPDDPRQRVLPLGEDDQDEGADDDEV